MIDVKGFLASITAKFKNNDENIVNVPLRLSMPSLPGSPDELSLARRRMGIAKELLRDPVFQEAIQFMNEQVVEDIAKCDALDTNRLTVLRLHLGVITDFPQALVAFIDEYEMMLAIRREQQDKFKSAEGAA
jgi:hypothetical protein